MREHVFTDTGASAARFVSAKFAKQYCLSMIKLEYPCKLNIAGAYQVLIVIQCAPLHFRLKHHYDKLWCFVSSIGKFDLILRMLWLEQHDFIISFHTKMLRFDSYYYIAHWLSRGKASIKHIIFFT